MDSAPLVVPAHIGAAQFPVVIGDGLGGILTPWWPGQAGGAAFVISDSAVGHLADPVCEALQRAGVRVVRAPVPSGERSKSFAELDRLTRLAAREGIRRSDAVVAVGGGVVGDLAGFVAAAYQRGVQLVHVPTTLLAMVDSAIGGKTGIDLPEGKNYVGAIWQPSLVFMDVSALDTLPARELAAGFAEVIKYGLLQGGSLQERIVGWPALPGERTELIQLIQDCVAHKLGVVAEDEREQGLRASLNLGHTVGHGIEAAAGYERYLHGEAISLGMLVALRLSEQVLGLDPAVRQASTALFDRHDLPTTLDDSVATSAILAAMGRDKKADAAALNMVLIAAPGDVRLRQNPPLEAITAAIEELRA